MNEIWSTDLYNSFENFFLRILSVIYISKSVEMLLNFLIWTSMGKIWDMKRK